MKIAYVPFQSQGNAYIDNMKMAFETLGQVEQINYKKMSLYRRNAFDLVVLNWRESYFINKKNGKLSFPGIIKEFCRIILLSFSAKQTCLVIHNNYPHETKLSQIKRIRRIQKLYQKFFNVMLCHSGESRSEKSIYIPHPKYFNHEENKKIHKTCNEYYVIFGRIQPYKNIESIFPFLDDNIKVLIAGPCSEPSYIAELESSAPQSVLIKEGFMDEEESRDLISRCKGLILLGNNENMIVSGSFHYGMSCNAKIFALRTPYLTWYKNEYSTSNIHIAANMSELIQLMRSASHVEYDLQEALEYHQEHSVERVAMYLKTIFLQDKS